MGDILDGESPCEDDELFASAQAAPAPAPATASASVPACSSCASASQEFDYDWKRGGLHGRRAYINGYVRLSVIDDIKTELKANGAEVYDEFKNSCFGHFLRFDAQNFICNSGLHAIMVREVVRKNASVDEFWFRVGDQFVRFSKYEYALVTGLRFGDSEFDPNRDYDPPDGGVYHRCIDRLRRKKLDDIRYQFCEGKIREKPGDAVKVAKVLFVYYVLFGLDGRQTSVDNWVWTLVEHSELWERFPWGKYSYQILSHYMREIPQTLPNPRNGRLPSYHFYGCLLALMVWACEAIPALGRKCGERVLDDDLQRPRCTRWRLQKVTIDFTGFFDDQIDCYEKLDPTPEEREEVNWQGIDTDLRLGVQYIHRKSNFKRRKANADARQQRGPNVRLRSTRACLADDGDRSQNTQPVDDQITSVPDTAAHDPDQDATIIVPRLPTTNVIHIGAVIGPDEHRRPPKKRRTRQSTRDQGDVSTRAERVPRGDVSDRPPRHDRGDQPPITDLDTLLARLSDFFDKKIDELQKDLSNMIRSAVDKRFDELQKDLPNLIGSAVHQFRRQNQVVVTINPQI